MGHAVSTLVPPTTECEHGHNSSIIRKRRLKFQSEPKSRLLGNPCYVCKVVYAFWSDYAAALNIQSQEISEPLVYCDRERLTSSFKTKSSNVAKIATSKIDIQLESRQNGEAYHALICGLLLKIPRLSKDKHLAIRYGKATTTQEVNSTNAIQELFKWYRITKKSFEGTAGGKDVVTRVIADAFRMCNNPGKDKSDLHQSDVFYILRRQLNPDFKNFVRYVKSVDARDLLKQSYFAPASAAKYWLNRYLRLTSYFEGEPDQLFDAESIKLLATNTQIFDRRKNPTLVDGPIRMIPKRKSWIALPTGPPKIPPELQRNPPKLPKMEDVTRLAIIHIRGNGAKTAVGRIMDNENLKYVAKYIANANIVARAAGSPHFSHIMLYGDFDYSEAPGLILLVKQEMDFDVAILFISSPWESKEWTSIWPNRELKDPLKKLKYRKEEVDVFWGKFRSIDSDSLPVQVKSLAIWTALCERYHPKVCVIGHRSGFIEAAGFIGIPIFYLNNERPIIDKENQEDQEDSDTTGPGVFLWRPFKKTSDRLRELANVMNTFIPVESLKRIEKAADDEVLRVDPDYEMELAAALFMYMCCERPVKVRMGVRADDDLEFQIMPLWMARTDMMHDICEHDEHEDSQPYQDFMHLSPRMASQMGQDWLRETYGITAYALRAIEKTDKRKRWNKRWKSIGRKEYAAQLRSLISERKAVFHER